MNRDLQLTVGSGVGAEVGELDFDLDTVETDLTFTPEELLFSTATFEATTLVGVPASAALSAGRETFIEMHVEEASTVR